MEQVRRHFFGSLRERRPRLHEFPGGGAVLSYVISGSAAVKGSWGGTDAGDADIMEHEARSMLNTLGILEHDAKMGTLSGGQKKRAALARTLLLPSDILILDEPTNHLDEDMIRWLEQYLRRYRGTVITVTHDRYFLDQVTNRILEISRGKIYSYDANYSKFLELKAQREEMELATERKRQSIFDKALELDSVETRMGKKTIELHHVSKSYEGRKIVEDFDYIFLKNQTVAFVGSNGCGKSTLLKMIAGQIPPDEGSVEFGETIKMGYFAQEIPQMDENQRVIDYVKDIAEYIPTRDGRITASQMLERFLFTPDMQYAPIGKLSGGEKRRLYLLGVLQQGPNVLVMDEVTNELDIPTLTILEDYLNSFIGIVILVSHDRYFLDNVSDRIFAFDGCGHFRQYEGGYTDYLESKNRENGGIAEKSSSKASAEVSGGKKKATWDKGEKKLKFSYKEQKEFETIDDDIAALEQKIEELDAAMPASTVVCLN